MSISRNGTAVQQALPGSFTAAQDKVIGHLAANADKLDMINRRYSYAPKSDGTSLADEHAKAFQLEWVITNKTDTKQFLLFSTLFDDNGLNMTIFADTTELKSATNSGVIFADGLLIQGKTSGVNNGKDFTVESLDSQRKIAWFLKYAAQNSLRFVKFQMKSRNTVDNSKDSSNYDNKFKSFWFSPFADPITAELPMRSLQVGMDNFNPDMLDVDFQLNNFQALLTKEHYLQMQINSGTSLTISAFIGAQDSGAQSFWRDMKAADNVMRPVLATQPRK